LTNSLPDTGARIALFLDAFIRVFRLALLAQIPSTTLLQMEYTYAPGIPHGASLCPAAATKHAEKDFLPQVFQRSRPQPVLQFNHEQWRK
jgi:hypothetical protein